jgi:hypothetical protein
VLCCSLAGIIGGALLIGRWATGLAIIFDCLILGWLALGMDDGRPAPSSSVHEVPTLAQVLERARNAS